jgi:uncharacterized protein YndB with AHSA1/START domain
MRRTGLGTLVAMSFIVAANLHASVSNAAPDGFTIEHTFEVNGRSSAAYQAFVGKVGGWWDAEHSYSGKAANFSIEPRPNGCFCERWGNGAGIVHMTVLYVDPGKVIRMSGGLGPLQEMAVSGVLTLAFTETGNRTKVQFKYVVSGRAALGLDRMAPLVDQVMVGQMNRFERFLGTGQP